MKLKKSWYASQFGLVLTMDLEVEGETLSISSAVSDYARNYASRFGGMPAQFIEKDMRRDLMRELERRIFGSAL